MYFADGRKEKKQKRSRWNELVFIWVKNGDWKPNLLIITSVGGTLFSLKRKGLKTGKTTGTRNSLGKRIVNGEKTSGSIIYTLHTNLFVFHFIIEISVKSWVQGVSFIIMFGFLWWSGSWAGKIVQRSLQTLAYKIVGFSLRIWIRRKKLSIQYYFYHFWW